MGRVASKSPKTASADEHAKGATRKLSRHAALLEFDALPRRLVELTKLCVLDTLGVTIGASTLAPESRIVYEYVRELGGNPRKHPDRVRRKGARAAGRIRQCLVSHLHEDP